MHNRPSERTTTRSLICDFLCFQDFCMLCSALLYWHSTCVLVIVVSLNFPYTEGEKEVCTVQELKENNIYSRGNHRDFMSFLQKKTNQDPKVWSVTVLLLVAGFSEVASCCLLHSSLGHHALLFPCFVRMRSYTCN